MNGLGVCLSSSDFSDRIDAGKRNRHTDVLLSLSDLQQTSSPEARIGFSILNSKATMTASSDILGKREQSEIVTTSKRFLEPFPLP